MKGLFDNDYDNLKIPDYINITINDKKLNPFYKNYEKMPSYDWQNPLKYEPLYIEENYIPRTKQEIKEERMTALKIKRIEKERLKLKKINKQRHKMVNRRQIKRQKKI